MLTLAQQSTCKSQNPGASMVSSFCNVESELMEGFFSHCTRIARLYMYLKLHNYELLQMHSEILSLLINCPPCELNTCGRVSHCERWDQAACFLFLPSLCRVFSCIFLRQWWFPPQMSLDLDCMPDLDGESESLRSELILFPVFFFPPTRHYQFKPGNIGLQQLSFVDILVMIWQPTRDEDIQMLGERLPPRCLLILFESQKI